MGDGEHFGPATEQYGDWNGTVAMDGQEGSSSEIYEHAQLSRDEWLILAIEIWGGELSDGGRVLAVPRAKYPNYDALKAAEAEGTVHVTGFFLPPGTLSQFKRWVMRVQVRRFNFDLVIDETRGRD